MATFAFIYAHPDDGSFGIAGTAMKLAQAGHTTSQLTLSARHGRALSLDGGRGPDLLA